MSFCYYGPLLALAASISLSLGGCGSSSDRPVIDAADRPASSLAPRQDTIDDPLKTDATIWTVLGLAKRDSLQNPGPQTGSLVSPVLWEASHDALQFAGFSSEDPVTGFMMTKWYSPPAKPDERLRISVFILARALRSDSVAVTVDREQRSAEGQWQKAAVAKDVVDGLDTAILLRARQIHAERYRDTTYN